MEQIAYKAGLKLFSEHLQDYVPKDPLYEEYVDKRGRHKRRLRELPPGLSKRDEKILKKVKRRAHYLDKGFKIGPFRFGWTFFIGIIPFAGDVADASLNYLLVVRKCQQAEIPPWLLEKMLFNNLVSAGIGFVPIVGDVLLATWKANSRNAALLEEFLRIRADEHLKLAEGKHKELNPHDAAQIKPGDGKAPGEVIPVPEKKGGGSIFRRNGPGKTGGALSSGGGTLKGT